jgi:hypothetical protein
MNVKKLFLIAIIVVLSAGAATAQENATPVVQMESGFVGGYAVATSTLGTAFRLGLGVAITDALRVNLSFINNQVTFRNYQLLSLDYSIIPLLGVSVSMGQDITNVLTVAGVGLYSTVLGNRASGGLQTGLRIRMDYLSPVTNGFQNGALLLGVSMLIGI